MVSKLDFGHFLLSGFLGGLRAEKKTKNNALLSFDNSIRTGKKG
jgi:hypothetical protein